MNYWIGQVTHEDDRDGYEDWLIVPNDLSEEVLNECLKRAHDDFVFVVERLPREEWEKFMQSIEEKWDTHHINGGALADLTEPYELG